MYLTSGMPGVLLSPGGNYYYNIPADASVTYIAPDTGPAWLSYTLGPPQVHFDVPSDAGSTTYPATFRIGLDSSTYDVISFAAYTNLKPSFTTLTHSITLYAGDVYEYYPTATDPDYIDPLNFYTVSNTRTFISSYNSNSCIRFAPPGSAINETFDLEIDVRDWI